MKRGHKLAIAVLIIASLLAVTLHLSRSEEPVYHGRRLSQWVLEYENSTDPDSEAYQSIQHIGTNALPTLLHWISYDPPGWRLSLADWFQAHDQYRLYCLAKNGQKVGLAFSGFNALGTNAYSAIPKLLSMLRSKSSFISGNALTALMTMPPSHYLVAAQGLTNRDATVRANAAFYFERNRTWPGIEQSLVRTLLGDPTDARTAPTNTLRTIAAQAIPTASVR